MSNCGNALFHVVGSRKDMEINQLSGKLEDEQSLVVQLQRKIKELQVRKISAPVRLKNVKVALICTIAFVITGKIFAGDSKKNFIK